MVETRPMELSKFVSDTIVQITSGVTDAAKRVQEMGGQVNPLQPGGYEDTARETKVTFSLNVGVESTKETGGKAKVAVFGQGVEGGAELTSKNTVDNRVAFEIVVQLPAAPRLKGPYADG